MKPFVRVEPLPRCVESDKGCKNWVWNKDGEPVSKHCFDHAQANATGSTWPSVADLMDHDNPLMRQLRGGGR